MTSPPIKAAVRLKRLKSRLEIDNQTRHGQRHGKIKHVDAARTRLNQHWEYSAGRLVQVVDAPDLWTVLERRREDRGAGYRKGTPTLATEALFIASKGAFVDTDGQTDIDRAKEWAEAMIEAFEAKYPGISAAARLDLDEATPHLSVFACPIYLKGPNAPRADVTEEARSRRKPRAAKPMVSHKQVFGSIDDMRAMQVWVQQINAEFLHRFGLTLTPSTPKDPDASGNDYIPPRMWPEVKAAIETMKDAAAEDALKAAAEAAAKITAAAQEAAADITREATAERDAARTAAAEARQAAENARDEAKALLDVVKVAQPLAPLHAAYEALLDGSSLTPQQTLAAQLAADQDCKWIEREVFTPRENGFDRADRDAAVWFAHPEVQAEIRDRRPDPVILDLMNPPSASIGFRARFINRVSGLRDLVMSAVKAVIHRRATTVPAAAEARLNEPAFRELADLGDSLTSFERARMDLYDNGQKSAAADAARRERDKLLADLEYPETAARAALWDEAIDHARAASVVAARIQRGPRQVVQWLQIPRHLRETFTAALAAAAKLETALARRTPPDPEKQPVERPDGPAAGSTPPTTPAQAADAAPVAGLHRSTRAGSLRSTPDPLRGPAGS